MDDFLRQQRQNDSSMRHALNPSHQRSGQEASQQKRTHQASTFGSDRQRSTTEGGHSMSGNSSSGSYGGYYQQPGLGAFPSGPGAPPNVIGYGQDTRHPPNFGGGYSTAPGVMYNVSHTGPQTSVFDADQPFPSRQSGAMQMLPAGVNTASYFPNDPLANAATVMHTTATPTGYSGNLGATQAGSLPSHRATGSTSDRSLPTPAVASTQDYSDTNEAYESYQRTLKDVFKNIRSGALQTAAEHLLQISDWILSNVEQLGLTIDDEDLYESRIKLWRNFNNAWLGLLERQKQAMISGAQLQRSQNLMSLDDMQKLGRELIRLCDNVERFGLVDYDYGVWEERIMDSLTECVELYRQGEDGEDAAVES